MKKKLVVVCFVLLSFALSGCANLAGLVSLGAAGYGLYKVIDND